MTWIWPSGNTIPTWSSTLGSATTTTNPIWNLVVSQVQTASTAPATTWWSDSQALLQQQQHQIATQEAYNPYQFQLPRFAELLWAPARPSLITRQEQAHRDEMLYRRAVAEHDEQEAARLLRIVEQHARTEEERARLLAEQHVRQQEAAQRRMAAQERARELLREHLTPQQLETFDRNGWFIVEGGRTKRKYRIRSGTVVANVDVIGKDERTMHRLCGHVPVDRVPPGDQMLAQKIMIELAEDDFLRIANRH